MMRLRRGRCPAMASERGHAKGFRRPLGGVFGQVNGGLENPRNHGGIQPWVELKRDFLADLELLQSFVEKSALRAGND